MGCACERHDNWPFFSSLWFFVSWVGLLSALCLCDMIISGANCLHSSPDSLPYTILAETPGMTLLAWRSVLRLSLNIF